MIDLTDKTKQGKGESPSTGSLTGKNSTVLASQEINESKLLRKIDGYVIPTLFILYIMAFLDRVNIGNAVVFGLKQDLHLGGVEYNVALTIFFIPYILFEIPSNIMLKKLGPRVWLPSCMFLFGLVTTLQGLVQSYSGLLATRFFLGVFEAGIFPGCFYIISMWYKRVEVQKRSSFFFSSTAVAGAFGGLLASAIGKLDGVRGYRAWRWIFILEGLLTCIIAAIFFFMITDFPEQSNFLTEEEKDFIRERLRQDVGTSAIDETVTLKDVGACLMDYRVIVGALMLLGSVVTVYGYAYFAPTIVHGYGYSEIETQLHSVPPWVVAFVFSMIVATTSDRVEHRFTFVLGSLAVCITGEIVLLTVYDKQRISVQYFALFLVTSGIYGSVPILISWFTNNLGGHHRRCIGSAFQIGFANVAGIIASFAFFAAEKPRYIRGYSMLLAFMVFTAIMTVAYWLILTRDNRRKDKGLNKYIADPATWDSLSDGEKARLGDLGPSYRYLR